MVRTTLSEALELYRRLAARMALTALLVFAPLAAGLLVLELLAPSGSRTEQALAIIDAVGSLLLFAPLTAIITLRVAFQVERGEPPQPAREVMEALALLPAYVLTQLLVLLVIVALPGALILAGLGADAPLLVSVGAGILIASVIVNGVRLTLATVPVVTGEARYALALRRSAQVTKGRYWPTLGVLALTSLLVIAIALVLNSIGFAAPLGAGRSVLNAITSLIANAITVPLITTVAYRLYRRLAEDRPVPAV